MQLFFIFLFGIFLQGIGLNASFAAPPNVQNQQKELSGWVYEFDGEDSEYDIADFLVSTSTDNSPTLGKLILQGNISQIDKKDDYLVYQIADGTLFSLKYQYNYSLANAAETDWHLSNDSGKQVNHVQLDEKIKKGAIILQTSSDGKRWNTVKAVTDVWGNVRFGEDEIKDIQLLNGWYYRIIVAFQVEKTTPKEKSWFKFKSKMIDVAPKVTQYKKYAEVYSFYAEYKKEKVKGEIFCYEDADFTRKAKKNNYAETEKIRDKDDFQYGWKLGKFCLEGYTVKGVDKEVYQKTIGHKVKLSFKLFQDISRLNGNEKLFIDADKDGSDAGFQTKPHDMKRGELVIKHIGKDGSSKINEYHDFLAALTSPAADTILQLFEEGDYEVHLNYAIRRKTPKLWETTSYYQTAFKFKIENGNCMAYIFDAKTNEELFNEARTLNGFWIDSAKSKTPKVTVKKEIFNTQTKNFDMRFNKPVNNEDRFTDEGKYTITIRCPDDMESFKTIYVGENKPTEKGDNRENKEYSVEAKEEEKL